MRACVHTCSEAPWVCLQDVAEVVASVEALAGVLEVGPREAQELVTREPR